MRNFIFLAFAILMIGCGTTRTISIDPEVDEIRDLDTLLVTASKEVDYEEMSNDLPIYRPSFNRSIDLLHTKLELSFNWKQQQVIGLATLKATPLAKAQKVFQLDAKNFDINSITSLAGDDLNYEYEDDILYINLEKLYRPGENIEVVIDYIANPTIGSGSGSAAISSDQGLFFINPTGEDPFKPQQIWTQGETEWNSRWFPTVDKPNERCTQEVYLTVEERFNTLSNGSLISSIKNTDGTRTDYWKMDIPHAPYLFALAIGEYAVVSDTWKNIPVDYYVEPEFEKDARKIFPYTIEMLDFFSEKLDMEYPWPKFSQVVVRDYVSGAMENTTAVIFGEFMQDDARALEDNIYSEQIVAHEMFHHWFGDFVTCESWSNLTMNEGFANYSEYLWVEHKHGRLEADYLRLTELQGYIQSIAYQGHHPLIHFGVDNKEDMFDAHSYNKGGLVLHMLRRYVGDDIFFKGLNLYLKENALSAVEAHNLRLAFEKVTGEDLNWFWNQWYFASGHPKLEVSKSILDGSVLIAVQQTQEGPKIPNIFKLPVKVDIFKADGSKITEEIWIDQRVQSFKIPTDFHPAAIVFDADDTLLAEIEYEPKAEELPFIFKYAEAFHHQYLAFGALLQSPETELSDYARLALNHESWVLRFLGITALEGIQNITPFYDQISQLAESDPHMLVQSAAIDKIGNNKLQQYEHLIASLISENNPFEVTKAAIKALNRINSEKVSSACEDVLSISDAGILYWCSQSFSESSDQKYWTYFDSHLGDARGEAAFEFFEGYIKLSNETSKSEALTKLQNIAAQRFESPARRAAAFQVYKANVDASLANQLLETIRKNTNEELFLLITKERE